MNNCLHFYNFIIFKYFENKKKHFVMQKLIKKRATAKANFAKIYRYIDESSKEDDSNLLKKKILH